MRLDAIGAEPQFIAHLAPVWMALPHTVRGRFLVDLPLLEYAQSKGIAPTPFDAMALRNTPQVPPVRDGMPCLVASVGDIKLGRRLGYGPFAYLEHGAGQSYESRSDAMASYAGGPDREDNELFLVPNEYSGSRWRKAYPSARVEVVGSPRLDDLPRRDLARWPKETVAITFHWPGLAGIPYSGNALGDFHPVLPALAKAYNVIGHAHPKGDWPERMERLYQRAGIPFVRDFDDVCRQADLLIADNTSVLFEFAATGRPVVVMNASHWHKGHGPGLRFWDAAGVGINVDRPEWLIPTIEASFGDPITQDIERREAALRFVYQPSMTGGAKRAAQAVIAWIEAHQAVAA